MSSSGNGVSNEQLMAYYEELGNFYCDLEADGKEDNDMEAGHPTDHSRKADVALCNKCGKPVWNGTIHWCEAGASTLGER